MHASAIFRVVNIYIVKLQIIITEVKTWINWSKKFTCCSEFLASSEAIFRQLYKYMYVCWSIQIL